MLLLPKVTGEVNALNFHCELWAMRHVYLYIIRDEKLPQVQVENL
jgi:hypothetical protein